MNKKNIMQIIFSVIFFFLFSNSALAEEKIDDFQVTAKLNTNGNVTITENIAYNFGDAEKHGIYRDIPVVYDRKGTKYKLRIDKIKAVMDSDPSVPFTTSQEGDYLRIKIGDANKVVTGKKLYTISYDVIRAINYFKEQDEFYWNATGNGWQIPIAQSALTVLFPQEVEDAKLKSDCFSGPAGSTNKCLSWRYVYSSANKANSAVYVSDVLNAGSGLTAVIGFPKGVIKEPFFLVTWWYFLVDNFWILVPILAFAIMYAIWYKRGRDPEEENTIIAQFDVPDNLTPAEVGTILDNTADNIDISADIIGLAVRGYIKINRIEVKKVIFKSSDYELVKLKDENDLINEFEKKIMSSLFGKEDKIKLSDLEDEFYKDLENIKKQIYNTVTTKGYFSADPSKVRNKYMIAGFVVLFISFYFFGVSALAGICMILTSVIMVVFGYLMPQPTIKGQRTREYIKGLKLYLGVAEKDRLEFHNAPEKNPQLFEKLLPFAIALKVEEKWAKQFEGIYKGQPSWYNDPSGANFNSILFVSSLNNFTSSANTTLSSAPSQAGSGGSGFGGGGSSGGGFGGGGGGSW